MKAARPRFTVGGVCKALVALLVLISAYRCSTAVSTLDPDKVATSLASATQIASVPRKRDCNPSDFSVSAIRTRREYDMITFTGTVRNSGPVACGVQLKASTYDKAGGVMDTSDFWPASIRNIAASASENFSYHLRYDKGATNFDVVTIDAKVWRPH